MRANAVPSEQRIYAWIEEIFAHGVRRPGYGADRWAEGWIAGQFEKIGLERVRAEPVAMRQWTPREAHLSVTDGSGSELTVPCFQLPHTVSTEGALEGDLALFDPAAPEAVRGRVALYDLPLLRVPHAVMAKHVATWAYDPAGTFATGDHVMPFPREMMHAVDPVIDAGATAFIGALRSYPGDSYRYYVPYDAVQRPIPAVWIAGSDGARVQAMLHSGPARARVHLVADDTPITSYNIVGELPGADEETVIIGSHHDGPWASAVEDASGIALVLAQATYWAAVPRDERPHRMVFLLNSGHMAGGAGQATFVREHRDELDRCVLEVHLEHVAAEFAERDGALVATGEPEVRWWFTSERERLQASVRASIAAEDVRRSLILRPEAFGEKPTTDGADFHIAGVPLVHHLAAPFYLFDEMDTLDKIHRPSLVPVTRAALRIIEQTRDVSAAEMRT